MKKSTPVKQYLLGLNSVFLVLSISAVIALYPSVEPRLDAEKLATQAAVERADLTDTSLVELCSGSEAYYSVYGTAPSGEQGVVSADKDNDEVYVYSVNDGISRREVKRAVTANGATGISKAVYGVRDKTPIWEVATTNGYYLVNFEVNELMKKEDT